MLMTEIFSISVGVLFMVIIVVVL